MWRMPEPDRRSARSIAPGRSLPYLRFAQPGREPALGDLVVERRHGLNPAKKLLQIELLVGGVNAIVGQPDADEHLRQAKHPIEARDRPDRATGSDEDRRFAEARLHRTRGSLDNGMFA